MTYFAPVAPPELMLDMKDKGVLGKYHLLLAHDVVDQEKLYREIFDKEYLSDCIIIMDNSVVELGKPVDAATMAKAKEIVPYTVAVLPDQIGDCQRTIELTMTYHDLWHESDIGPFMFVPQGQSMEEHTLCLASCSNLDIAAISVPRHATEVCGTREHLINLVSDFYPDAWIHLLGFSTNYSDDAHCARMERVVGIDSAEPMHRGWRDVAFTMGVEREPPMSRGDYWEKCKTMNPLMIANLAETRNRIGDHMLYRSL